MKSSKLFLLIALCFVSFAMYAQEYSPLVKGTFQLNAGASFDELSIGPGLSFDYAIHNDVSLGFGGVYRSYSEQGFFRNWQGDLGVFSAFANYHFNSLLKMSNKWDLYAGLSGTFFNLWRTNENNLSTFSVDIQVGGRYYFTQKLGIVLEGNTLANIPAGYLGLSFKL